MTDAIGGFIALFDLGTKTLGKANQDCDSRQGSGKSILDLPV
jgi:hypothetical protein